MNGLPVAAHLTLDDAALEAIAQRVADILDRRRPDPDPASPYMTIPEAADYLRCSRQRVDDLLSSGRLRRHKDGRRTLVSRAELERYVARAGDA